MTSADAGATSREQSRRRAPDMARGLSLLERSVALLGRVVFGASTRVKVEGFHDAPRSGPLIIVVNHMSNADPPLLGGWLLPAMARPVAFLAKSALFVGAFGDFLRSHGMIEVKAGGSDIDAYRQARAVLDQGGVVCIFPEGTRSRTGALIEAKQGVVVLAARTGVPVLPIGISGTDRFLSPESTFPRVGARLRIRAGKPFRVELPRRATRDQIAAATDDLMGRIAYLIEPRHRGRYAPVPPDAPPPSIA
jgi:1-acyl-sn-glycerol-3-phosphate acyltransferase